MERRPIIRRAMVRRHLPDRISLTVNERVPLARLGRTPMGQNWLVSADGVLIGKSVRNRTLPFIKGIGFNLDLGDNIGEGRAKEALAYLVIWSDLSANKRELLDIQDISVGHPEYLDWRLRNGYQLLLPREGDFDQLLQRASRLIHENEQRQLNAQVLDLRPEAALVIGSPE
jgi:cell division protein FtsQ